MRSFFAPLALFALLLGLSGGCGFDQILVVRADGDDTGDSAAGPSGPPAPGAGEVVISEVMIDPVVVDDSVGEWVEVWSAADDVRSLAGCALGDLDVDDAPLSPTASGSLEIEPGDFVVLCSHGARAENGGVECDGTYTYSTWGEGFALANGGDEIQLRAPNGQVIDEVTYVISTPGVSSGLDPSAMDASRNDDAGQWCDQRSALSGGDIGTPGSANDPC